MCRDENAAKNICFNSATPACAWRLIGDVGYAFEGSTLQFGHACLRVETRLPTELFRCSRGTLQFGHACLRVETLYQFLFSALVSGASIRPRLLARGDASSLTRMGL